MAEITAKTPPVVKNSPIPVASPIATSVPAATARGEELQDAAPVQPAEERKEKPPSEPSPAQTDEQREKELQDAVALAESGTIEGTEDDTPEYWKSVADIKAKLALAEQVRQQTEQAERSLKRAEAHIGEKGWTLGGEPLTQEVFDAYSADVQQRIGQDRELVYGKVAPFVTLAGSRVPTGEFGQLTRKDPDTGKMMAIRFPVYRDQITGEKIIDAPSALKAGATEKDLLAAGISEAAVNQASAQNYIDKVYQGDLYKANQSGDMSAIQAAYPNMDVDDIEAIALQNELARYPTYQAIIESGNIDLLRRAAQLGLITPDEGTAGGGQPVKGWKNLSPEEQVGLTLVGLQSGVADIRSFERWINNDAPDSLRIAYETGGAAAYEAEASRLEKEYKEQQAIMAQLKSTPGAYTPQEVLPPGVYGPPKPESYDWVAALLSGEITTDQLKKLGLDSSFVDATQDYAIRVQGLIDKINQGVKTTGKGLSQGIGLTGPEANDLATAMREAGLNIEGGSAVNTWRNMTDEQRYQVANVLTGYPSMGELFPSAYRGLQSVAADERLGFAPKLALTVATAPFTAIIAPFVKDMTVGELKQKVDLYAKQGADGKIADYNLTQYLKDNPYDAPLLARGGFSIDEIEKAQKGEKVNVMPEGATPLDWAIAGVMVAAVALPMLKWGAMSLGTRLIQPVMSPGLRLGTMALAQAVYRGAVVGEFALKWGLPAGMTSYTVANWNKMTPEQRAVAGVFTGLTYIPVLGSLYRFGAGNVAKAQAMNWYRNMGKAGAIRPRGLTTGYQDVYAVKPPPDFFAGVRGDTRTTLMKIVNDVKTPTATRLSQVAALLEPTVVAPAFMQTAQLAMDVSKFSVPSSQFVAPEAALEAVQGMTPAAATKLAEWLSEHPDVYVMGSTAMKAQGIDVTPHDIDLFTSGNPSSTSNINKIPDPTTFSKAQIASYKAYAAQLKAQIARILEQNGTRIAKKKGDGGVGIDISYPGKRLFNQQVLSPLPYGWESQVPPPVVVGGIKFQSLGEQSLRLVQNVVSPGVGASKGLMGPGLETLPPADFPAGHVGTFEGRIKDIEKFQLLVKDVINQLNAAGDTARVAKLQGYLDTFANYRTRLADGSVKPLTPEETQDLNNAFLEAVSEVQLSTLVNGGNALLLDPSTGLVVSKIVSPAGEVLPGTVYFASRDLTADISMLQIKGKWGPTGKQVFFSPEAAYDFLIDRTTGKLGPNAGIMAVRTDPKVDMGPNGIITGPFRYEYIDGKPVVYNELVSEGEFYATEPNVRAFSDDSIFVKQFSKSPGEIYYRGMASIDQPHMKGITYYTSSQKSAKQYGKEQLAKARELGINPDIVMQRVKVASKNPIHILDWKLSEAGDVDVVAEGGGDIPELGLSGKYLSSLGEWGDIKFDEAISKAAKEKGYDALIVDFSGLLGDEHYVAVLDESIVTYDRGFTGESVTYYPRTKTKVPILWTATKAAQLKGLGAPSPVEVSRINRMALLDSIATVLFPKNWHWSEITTSELPPTIKSSLIEFYRDTYRVGKLPPEKLAILLQSGAKDIVNKAITNLKSRGAKLTESSIHAEVNNIYRIEATSLVKWIYKKVGVTVSPQEIENVIATVLAKGGVAPVEEITGMLDSLDPTTRSAVTKDAQAEYDAEIGALQKLSPEASAALSDSDKIKRLYHLNLGKLSTKMAALATTASILTATAPAIANTLIPATRITSPVSGTVPPTTVGGIPTLPTAPSVTPVKPTTIPVPRTVISEIPTAVITPTTPTEPTVPTHPTTPTTPTIPTEPTTPTVPTTPTIPTTPKPGKGKPILVISLRSDGGKETEIPQGSIAWAQGIFWKYIPPPYTQPKPITLPKGVTPIGAIMTHLRKPKETIQKIGDSDVVVPDKVSADLGITDLFISNQAQDIDFTGGGEATDAGTRMPSTTQGMSLDGGGAKGHAYARKVYPKSSVSRTAMDVEEPERGVQSLKGGINRPKIADDTKKMLEGEYVEPEALEPEPAEELPYGSFGDEDPDWLKRFNGEVKKPVNRVRMTKKKPVRGRGIPPTTLGGIR